MKGVPGGGVVDVWNQITLPRRNFRQNRGTECTPAGRDGNIAEAFGALLGRRVGCRLSSSHPRQKPVHRHHNKEIDGSAYEDEREQCVDKVANQELASVERKLNCREVRFPTIAAIKGVIRS